MYIESLCACICVCFRVGNVIDRIEVSYHYPQLCIANFRLKKSDRNCDSMGFISILQQPTHHRTTATFWAKWYTSKITWLLLSYHIYAYTGMSLPLYMLLLFFLWSEWRFLLFSPIIAFLCMIARRLLRYAHPQRLSCQICSINTNIIIISILYSIRDVDVPPRSRHIEEYLFDRTWIRSHNVLPPPNAYHHFYIDIFLYWIRNRKSIQICVALRHAQ